MREKIEILKKEQKAYVEAHIRELEDLVLRLAPIPAPTGQETRRAQFCLEWLRENGAKEAYLDKVGNVIYAYECKNKSEDFADIQVQRRKSNDKRSVYGGRSKSGDEFEGIAGDKPEGNTEKSMLVFMAHMDVVFSDTTELLLQKREGRIYCPGICDNTANLAVLLMAAKYAAEKQPDTGGRTLLFVCGVGEEGLGNLKGAREICRRFGGQMEAFYAFDLTFESYTSRAVGSLRYEITVKTKGGHSYGDFGNTSAIAVLAELIGKLYSQSVPARGKTTYNVGTISGGTSVNTIAQAARMLYEIRSDHGQDLAEMKAQFEGIVDSCRERYQVHTEEVSEACKEICAENEKNCWLEGADALEKKRKMEAEISVELLGERPCEQQVDERKRQELFRQAEAAVEAVTGKRPESGPCSTDCNIPLSMGIPSVCIGMCRGAGFHTREEYLEKDSLKEGLAIGLLTVFCR